MKVIKAIAFILFLVAIFLTVINIIPPMKNIENNPFIVGEGELPMIAAHRGGGDNNPENTMLAFREAVSTYKVDIIESDIYLTKDGHLVFNHDPYIDRTCNANGDVSFAEAKELYANKENRHYIKDMTLEELREYNFGYYFENEKGERIYKDSTDLKGDGLQITTVEELFDEFYESNPDLLFIIEIKNEGEMGYEACDKLVSLLNSYPEYKDNIVVGSFHPEVEEYLETNHRDIMRGASTDGVIGFVITHFAGVNIFNKSSFACLQIPMEYDVGITVKLDLKSIIDRAHLRNIAVQYWTINDEADMRYLIALGCDCIMTDNPALLRQVIDEQNAKSK